jgi:Cu(I)/Ag(I) efflux system membrane fusion protein
MTLYGPDVTTPPEPPALAAPSARRRLWLYLAAGAAAVLVLVLLWRPIVAWFTGKPMGGGRTSEAVATRAGGLSIEAALSPDPPRMADNALLLTVRDAGGDAVDDAEVDVEIVMPAMGAMAEMRSRADVENEGDGRYRAAFDVQMTGTWTAEVEIAAPAGTASPRYSFTIGRRGLTAVGATGPEAAAAGPPAAAAGEHAHGDEISHYTCSMHPSVHKEGPGTCPICSMDLVPVTREEVATGTIVLGTQRVQQIGVRTGRVARRVTQGEIRTVGRVVLDETRLEDVTVKFGGWIEDLRVNETGQPVRRGQTLFTLYSPELYAAQQEYLVALRSQRAAQGTAAPDRADYLVQAARQKLALWDLTAGQIRQIAERGQPLRSVPVLSPASGYVLEKNVVEGAAVQPGMPLFRIGGLDRVWVEADVYEAELPRVALGQPARVTLPYQPGQVFPGRVGLVLPTLTPETRTGRVRIEIANRPGPGGVQLRPGMYTDVFLDVPVRDALLVPESAVLYTGPRALVFLALGEGRFQPREVKLGAKQGDAYEVVSGLAEGDVVVTSGNFLIAAESRLKAATELW